MRAPASVCADNPYAIRLHASTREAVLKRGEPWLHYADMCAYCWENITTVRTSSDYDLPLVVVYYIVKEWP